MVTLAPGTKAPDGSLIVPRSEVVASWLNRGVAVERIHRSIHPSRDFFTLFLQKTLTCLVAWLVVKCDLILFCTNVRNRPRSASVAHRTHSWGKSGNKNCRNAAFQQHRNRTPDSRNSYQSIL